MPAENKATVVTRLERENLAKPLIPWPEVHPPAIRAPSTMVNPPAMECAAFLGSMNDRFSRRRPSLMDMRRLKAVAANTTPPEKMTEGVQKAGSGLSTSEDFGKILPLIQFATS